MAKVAKMNNSRILYDKLENFLNSALTNHGAITWHNKDDVLNWYKNQDSKIDPISVIQNPIKYNRIVSDRTFARRLIGHLNGCTANCMMGDEEIQYLKRVADDLLRWQISTCPEEENAYHANCDK